MRVIFVGAKGEVGRSVLQGVARHKEVTEVIALFDQQIDHAVSVPDVDGAAIQPRTMDLLGDLYDQLRFADAVISLGPLVNGAADSASSRREQDIFSHLCDSVGVVGVRVFIYVSSVGLYAPASAGEMVDEGWPIRGAASNPEASQAAHCERWIDKFETDHPLIRTVRLRTGLVVCPSAATNRWRMQLLKRLFAMTRTRRHGTMVPNVKPLSIQCLHISDLVDALCLVLTHSVNGIFNIAGEPITSELLAARLGARSTKSPRPIRIPPRYLFKLSTVAACLHLVPLPAERIELFLRAPDVDTSRAQHELGWTARHSASSMLDEWISLLEPSASVAPQEEAPQIAAPGVDLASLYLASLDFFTRVVHAVRADQWEQGADQLGLCVWQIVAMVARAQYRVALEIRGYDDDRIEAELPGDPLGIARADGWDLAAERGVLALERWGDGDSERDVPSELTLEQRMAEVICQTVRRGAEIADTLGLDEEPVAELSRFVQLQTVSTQ